MRATEKLVLLALAVTLTTSAASAQSYGPTTPPNGSNEVVAVTAPKLQRQTSGVPIVDISLSREAGVQDLDLWTVYGASERRAGKRATSRFTPPRSARRFSERRDGP